MAKLGKKAAVISVDVNRSTKTHPGPKAEEVREIYKRDWEFVKPHSNVSPYRSKWDHDYYTAPEMAEYSFGKVPEFVKKTPHGFGHTGKAKVKGNLRCSGKSGAHQIGKRSK